MGLDFNHIKAGISTYTGVRRRFDVKGIHKDIMVVDDYAHHPSEVDATLKAAKSGWDRRIIAVFQPHLFSRTRDFFREFAKSINTADKVVLTEIYPARENPIPGVTARMIYDECEKLKPGNCYYIPDLDDLSEMLDMIANSGDMIILMGAGNIWRYSESYTKRLESDSIGVKD